MESPRATPDFRQPGSGSTAFETATRCQSDNSLSIGKSPNKPSPVLDDMTDVKPGIMEMIQEERRVSSIFHKIPELPSHIGNLSLLYGKKFLQGFDSIFHTS